jgi:hypothetical protein
MKEALSLIRHIQRHQKQDGMNVMPWMIDGMGYQDIAHTEMEDGGLR